MSSRELRTMNQRIQDTCARFPDRTAQVFNRDLHHGDHDGRFTYREMLARVEDLSCGLLSLGFAHGDRAGIMSRSSPYWTHADLAVSHCAGVSVTIYSTLSMGEVSHILNDSACRYVFVESEKEMLAILSRIRELPHLEKIIVMDLAYAGSDARTIGFDGLMALGREWKKGSPRGFEERWRSVRLEDRFTILYTSGTTGKGKGVILTHWCAASRLEKSLDFLARHGMGITKDDVTLCFLPLSHIFERGSCQLLALMQGACIAYADSPGTLLRDMQRYNPTWINCVPRLYEKIYLTFQEKMSASPVRRKLFALALFVGKKALAYRKDASGRYNMTPDFDLAGRLPLRLLLPYLCADRLFAKIRALFGTRFRFAFSASAGIAPDLLLFYYTLGIAVVEGYGSTESASACLLNPLDACKPGCMGIETDGSLTRVAPDGELEIAGAGIFKGYLNLPEDTKEGFTPDGWFKTGDVVEMDELGYYRMLDRKKAIICTATGKNIAPQKIESQFSLSHAIEQVFCIGDERSCITALIVPNFAWFVDLFDKEGIAYDQSLLEFSEVSGAKVCTGAGEDFVSRPLLRELIDREVQQANDRLESFETIRRYTILPQRFTERNGRLTPTQKTRKKVILKDYAEVIEGMYRQA